VTLSPNVNVSIVTVCLNAAESLEATIRSVIGQDLREREYVILDGGSTDGSASIIEKYKERLAYWQSEPDQGVCHWFKAAFSGLPRI
jgi:glycosyltransferase involved in cell wall biosynthesis